MGICMDVHQQTHAHAKGDFHFVCPTYLGNIKSNNENRSMFPYASTAVETLPRYPTFGTAGLLYCLVGKVIPCRRRTYF